MSFFLKGLYMKNTFKKLIVFGLLFFAQSSEMKAQRGSWVNTKITQDSLTIADIDFADSNIGYARGYLWKTYQDRISGIWQNYKKFYHFRTTDGGANWAPMSFGKYGFPEDINALFYDNNNTYNPTFTISNDYIVNPVTPTIAYTRAIYQTSDSVYQPFLLKTTNSGATWFLATTTPPDYILGFYSENFGFGKTIAGTIIYTVDGGSHWFPIPGRNKYDYTINGIHYQFNANQLAQCFFISIDSSHQMFFPYSNQFSHGSDSVLDCPSYGVTSFLTTNRGSSWEISNWIDTVILQTDTVSSIATNSFKTVKNSQYIFRFTGPAPHPYFQYSDYASYGSDQLLGKYGVDGGYRSLSATYATYYGSSDYGQSWIANRSFIHRTRDMVATTPKDIWMTTLTKPFENDSVIVFGKYQKDTIINGTHTFVFDSGWHLEFDWNIIKRNNAIRASWIVHSTDGGVHWDIDSTSLRDLETGEYDARYITSTDPRHLWIGAMKNGYSYVFRYKAPAVNAVEDDIRVPPPDYPNFINIYPNPANDKVTIALWRHAGIKQIRIFDILGREIKAPTKQLTQSSFELDVSLVAAGPYILVCDVAGGSNLARTLMVRK